MKKVLLVLFICVMINTGKDVFNTGKLVVSRLTNRDTSPIIRLYICPDGYKYFKYLNFTQ